MEATFATLTDEQRVETLNNVYQKGISMSREDLAFSADKLVYLKPFIGRLLNTETVSDLNSRVMIRQIVDELLADIVDEIALTYCRNGDFNSEKAAAEYGLNNLFASNQQQSNAYDLKRVA